MSYETIAVEVDGAGVALLTLNRPHKKNAMNPRLHEETTQALEALRYDDAVRVVVITGAGDSFSAGMDLKEFFIELKDKPAEYDRITRIATEWRGRTLRYFPKATVAMVNGYCFGGAIPIVTSCDLAVAANEAKFGLSEINFKMFPGGSVSKALGMIMPPREYLWYAMTGEPFDGPAAVRAGLVNRAVPRAELVAFTMNLAATLAGKDPSALRATKEAYRHSLGMDWDTAMNFAAAKEAEHVARQQDAFRKEGIGEFLDGSYKPGLGSHDKAPKK